LCQGQVMARNPRWCLTSGEWHTRFGQWISNTQPEQLLDAVIFFDFRALCGAGELADELRARLAALIERSPVFLRALAGYALETPPPLGVFGAFTTTDHPGAPATIDLKQSAARLFVDAARVIGLAAGIAHTNTVQRLRQGGPRVNLPAEEISAAADAFCFIQSLRLRRQLGLEGAVEAGPNRIDPERLNEVDRRILKESLRQARSLQSRLALDYRL
jgi:CBS domain-containing protein